jgi:predicted nuclease with TOPRIM domain
MWSFSGPQEGLLRVAGSMLRKRDPLAPSGLTDAQKRTVRQHPKVLELRREKRELMEEMRSLAGTIRKAREPFSHLYQRHEAVKKELSQLRKSLANNTQQTARKEYFHTAPVLEVDRQIKQLLGQSDVSQSDARQSNQLGC